MWDGRRNCGMQRHHGEGRRRYVSGGEVRATGWKWAKNIRSEVRLRRNEECSEQSKATERREKNVLSEAWLRRSKKRSEWSVATEKWKTFWVKHGYGEVKNVLREVKLRRRRKPESSSWRTKRRIHFVLFTFSLSNNCVFYLAQASGKSKIYIYL